MKVLLDECVPRRLGKELTGHEVSTVPQMGWGGITNGKLLDLARGKFDVLVTIDSNLPFQQNRATLPVSVVVLRARSNKLARLLPLVPAVLTALATVKPGELIVVGA
jgi:predicted nuclease of predicted toxin-antitoxin system